ncbi:uncharacterized protein LOC117172051 [Belonocnema kinseyi]|uniref:uncharacterized protein LOC117172051 n=1 Tax=Belonocnema kinseyi TaxID=2817044 RepID=UPI00143CED8F|nr:uncharacterized protein LOC117172051 [Belonocnema kinseyi]XP_033215678.1 uncharacterized protein LOC117172051 [Belonocnema kinseyi]
MPPIPHEEKMRSKLLPEYHPLVPKKGFQFPRVVNQIDLNLSEDQNQNLQFTGEDLRAAKKAQKAKANNSGRSIRFKAEMAALRAQGVHPPAAQSHLIDLNLPADHYDPTANPAAQQTVPLTAEEIRMAEQAEKAKEKQAQKRKRFQEERAKLQARQFNYPSGSSYH